MQMSQKTEAEDACLFDVVDGNECGGTDDYAEPPEVHNAFNETLIAELTDAFGVVKIEPQSLAVVLRGAGTSFCAGADLNWMAGWQAIRVRKIWPMPAP